jgi:hypothetical protein
VRKRSDFRLLRARRDEALQRSELRHAREPKTHADPEAVAAAIAAGRFTRLPAKKRR